MSDIVTNIDSSMIQHGKFNDRIYLMKLSKRDSPAIIDKLEKLALNKGYSKIFCKVPVFARDDFIENKYIVEAHVPEFYNGCEDVYFMARYFSEYRMIDRNPEENRKVLETAISESLQEKEVDLKDEFDHRICDKNDIPQMVEVYKKVFETYPFPIHDPQYILETMDDNIIYFGIWEEDRIVSLASCEMDIKAQNVEITDFATLPEYRNRGFSTYLLQCMENEMQMRDIKTAYTIARACSYGMNIVFSRAGYEYSGTLLNNTNISGNLESMNVWYKHL